MRSRNFDRQPSRSGIYDQAQSRPNSALKCSIIPVLYRKARPFASGVRAGKDRVKRLVCASLWTINRIALHMTFQSLPSGGQAMYNMDSVALPEAFAITINLYHFLTECAHRLAD